MSELAFELLFTPDRMHPTVFPNPERLEGYLALFERHPEPMWVFDPSTQQVLEGNEAAAACYGYLAAEFRGINAARLVAADCQESFRELCQQMVLGEVSDQAVVPDRHVRKDGEIVDVESSWTPVPFQNHAAVLVVIHATVSLRQAEQRSREQANLLDMASDAIMVCDLDGMITFWNQGAARLYGWTREEALGGPMVDMVMKETSVLAAVEEGLREEGEWSGELRQVSKDGSILTVNSRWTMVRDAAGNETSILVINTDLTETKRLEAQFLRAQRQESIGTLASGIAHDLNNILSPILMSVGLLRRSMTSPDQERMLGMIESSAERGAGIVKQVLTFARGVEGERVLLQPKHLVSEMAKILAQTFPKNIDLQPQFPPDLWTVMGDATQLHQVLLNLCVNARDAMMPKGGMLIIGAENLEVDQHFARMNPGAQLGDHVVLRVTDSGMGMPAETVDKIFDPFFTTKEVGKGTGLGLATVMGIVKSHGGFLTVQSEVGVGTTFRVYIPATRQVAESAATPAGEADVRGQGELVLVVDDEAPIREALVQTLQDHGYRAFTAEDGSDALALYVQRKGEIAVVLTDLAMGLMDGVALVRALRKYDQAVKVIVSSGHCDAEQAATLKTLGVRAFLDKPYNATKLLRALRETITGAIPAAK